MHDRPHHGSLIELVGLAGLAIMLALGLFALVAPDPWLEALLRFVLR